MSAQQDFSRLVDTSREVRRSPMVRMEPLHQGPMRFSDLLDARTRLKPQDLIGFFFRHYARLRMGTRPRVTISLSVFTPAGKPAIKIRL